MTVTFRKISVLPGRIGYADPTDINHTAKVNVTVAPKTAGAVVLTNVKSEYIEARKLSVTNGTDNSVENASFRCSLSGSTQNKVALLEMADRGYANWRLQFEDGGAQGLTPEVALIAQNGV